MLECNSVGGKNNGVATVCEVVEEGRVGRVRGGGNKGSPQEMDNAAWARTEWNDSDCVVVLEINLGGCADGGVLEGTTKVVVVVGESGDCVCECRRTNQAGMMGRHQL